MSWSRNLVSPFHIFGDLFTTCRFPENTRSCWPVRPIPRKNLIPDTLNNQSESTPSQPTNGIVPINPYHLPASNAAIGIVMPRTPNSTTLHHHQNQLNETAVSEAPNTQPRRTKSVLGNIFIHSWDGCCFLLVVATTV